jgi:hypothetical protein
VPGSVFDSSSPARALDLTKHGKFWLRNFYATYLRPRSCTASSNNSAGNSAKVLRLRPFLGMRFRRIYSRVLLLKDDLLSRFAIGLLYRV